MRPNLLYYRQYFSFIMALEQHPSYRRADGENKLRRLQRALQRRVPELVVGLNKRGFFPGTQIEKILKEGKKLEPNDITTSQLQMIVRMCTTFREKGLYPHFIRDYLFTNLLDGADGALARQLNMATSEGAMYDVIVDRLSETLLAILIAQERGRYEGVPENLEHNLVTAFQLSTLTKATCEMFGINTKEGGIGSMIERRRIIFNTLLELGELRKLGSGGGILKRALLKRIDHNNSKLVENSRNGALARIARISEKGNGLCPDLNDEISPAAVDARKYVAVLLLNEKLGLEMVDILNGMADGKVNFPKPEELKEKYAYIGISMERMNDLFNEALRIADINE